MISHFQNAASRAVAFLISGSLLLPAHLARCTPTGANHIQPWLSPGYARLVFMAMVAFMAGISSVPPPPRACRIWCSTTNPDRCCVYVYPQLAAAIVES